MRHLRLSLALCLLLALPQARSQAPAPSTLPDLPELPIAFGPEVSTPTIAPDSRLQGAALVSALRRGGLILYMRHGQSGDPRAECPGEPGLTDIGHRQVAAVGAAIRRLGVPVGALQASDTCRARDSALGLGLGQPVTVPSLGQNWGRGRPYRFEDRFPYLMEVPSAGTNLLLVAHVQNAGVRQDAILIELAEIVVYQPQPAGRPAPIARILPKDWKALLVEGGVKP
jgi:Histidine phosphatase superfamily (branch 1)